MAAISNGDRPREPENAAHLGFTKELWDTIKECWLEDRDARPCMKDIFFRLRIASLARYVVQADRGLD